MDDSLAIILEMVGRELADIEKRLHFQDRRIEELQRRVDESPTDRCAHSRPSLDAIRSSDLIALENRLKAVYDRAER